LGSQSLLTLSELNSLFTLGDTSKCNLETFEVMDQSGQALASTDDLYSRLSLSTRLSSEALSFDTTIAMTDGSITEVEFNLKIRATAEGGV
jgi:hypothetical protein